MEHIIENPARITSRTTAEAEADVSGPAYKAYQILRVGFTVAPIVAGLDKFFNLLVNWEQYLPPFVNNLVGAADVRRSPREEECEERHSKVSTLFQGYPS